MIQFNVDCQKLEDGGKDKEIEEALYEALQERGGSDEEKIEKFISGLKGDLDAQQRKAAKTIAAIINKAIKENRVWQAVRQALEAGDNIKKIKDTSEKTQTDNKEIAAVEAKLDSIEYSIAANKLQKILSDCKGLIDSLNPALRLSRTLAELKDIKPDRTLTEDEQESLEKHIQPVLNKYLTHLKAKNPLDKKIALLEARLKMLKLGREEYARERVFIGTNDSMEIINKIISRLGLQEALEGFTIDGKRIDAATFVAAMIKVESNWNIRAESHKGAKGLMQLMSATNSDMSKQAGRPLDVYNPVDNIEAGVRYIIGCLKESGKDIEKALNCYNCGIHGATIKGITNGDYVRDVLKAYRTYSGGDYTQPAVHQKAFIKDFTGFFSEGMKKEYQDIEAIISQGNDPFQEDIWAADVELLKLRKAVYELEQKANEAGSDATDDFKQRLLELKKQLKEKETLLGKKKELAEQIIAIRGQGDLKKQNALRIEIKKLHYELIGLRKEKEGLEEKLRALNDIFGTDFSDEDLVNTLITEIRYEIYNIKKDGVTEQEKLLIAALSKVSEAQAREPAFFITLSALKELITEGVLRERVIGMITDSDPLWVEYFTLHIKKLLGIEPPLAAFITKRNFLSWLKEEFPKVHSAFSLRQIPLYDEVEKIARSFYAIAHRQEGAAFNVDISQIKKSAEEKISQYELPQFSLEAADIQNPTALSIFGKFLFNSGTEFEGGIKFNGNLNDLYEKVFGKEKITYEQMKPLFQAVNNAYKNLFMEITPLMRSLERVVELQNELAVEYPAAAGEQNKNIEYLKKRAALRAAQRELACRLNLDKPASEAIIGREIQLDKVFDSLLQKIEQKVQASLGSWLSGVAGIKPQYDISLLSRFFMYLSFSYGWKESGDGSLPISMVIRLLAWGGARKVKLELNQKMNDSFIKWQSNSICHFSSKAFSWS